MKIENTSLPSLSSQPTESAKRAEKKASLKDAQTVRGGQDSIQMSEEARLLAKARAALGNVEEAQAEKLAALRSQIESGDYSIQITELARKLVTKLYPK